jgi:hypothetical protein
MRLAVLFTVALLSTPLPAQSDPLCPEPGPIPADWVEWDEGWYSVWLPPDFVAIGRGGFEDFGTYWRGVARRFSMEMGRYVDRLLGTERDGVHFSQDSLDGAPRITAFIHDTLPGIAGYWPNVYGQKDSLHAEGFTLTGRSPFPEDRTLFRTIISTARIHIPAHERPLVPPEMGVPPEQELDGADMAPVLAAIGGCWQLTVEGVGEESSAWARTQFDALPVAVRLGTRGFIAGPIGAGRELMPLDRAGRRVPGYGLYLPLTTGDLWFASPGRGSNLAGTLQPLGELFRGTLYAWTGRGPIAGTVQVVLGRMACGDDTPAG